MISDTIPELKGLPAPQKLLLASELWDAAMAEDFDIPASAALLEELDRRREEHMKDPSCVISWEEAKARILASKA
ncbi:MAG TPA: addiction module protein [Verrucomicrobiales bacterium]|nr:addiction module protein [Verrucomicrobiales bacterium]